MFKLFKPILELVPQLFTITLIFYLILFLLENLFPGFVSNNFDLNIFLLPIFILGILSAFAPTPKKEEKPVNITDYVMVGFLSLLAFIVLWYKTKEMGTSGLIIALGGSILVAMISLVILLASEESPFVETRENREIRGLISKHSFAKIRHLAQVVLFRGVKIPILFILLAIFIIYFLFNKSQNPVIVKELIAPTITPTPTVAIEEIITPSPLPTPNVEILKQIPITILNGSTKIGSASAMAKFLREKNFVISKIADADGSDYEKAIVRFRAEDLSIAEYLIEAIKGIYPVVEKAPSSTDSSQIILILGRP
jgi:hypothetical protein